VLTGLVELEDSVIYGVDAAGGVLVAAGGSAADQALLTAADADHRARRDQLTALLESRGAPVPAAEPGYLLPASLPGSGVTGALTFAARLEDRCAAQYRLAVGLFATPALRQLAIDALTDASVRGFGLRSAAGLGPGSALRAFPGGP
jgi:hypothetical protein